MQFEEFMISDDGFCFFTPDRRVWEHWFEIMNDEGGDLCAFSRPS